MVISKEQKKFDEWVLRQLENGKNPPHMIDALSRVEGTIFGASLAATAAFGKNAKPEHVLKILELTLAEREKILDEEQNHKEALQKALARKKKA